MDVEEECVFISSPWVEPLRLDLGEVRASKRLLELVLVLRRKCSSKSGRPERIEDCNERGDGDEKIDLPIGLYGIIMRFLLPRWKNSWEYTHEFLSLLIFLNE